jgi:peptidyl-prolyl cis-trans isomerase B (cyclophilin B)
MRKFSKIIIISGIAAAVLVFAGCSPKKENIVNQNAIVKTTQGEFTIELDSEAAPKTVENFIKKAGGEYNGRIFHRVEDWVVQGGDPSGNGTGGGDQATELSDRNFAEGAAGIARAGDIKVSNADQFFICKTDCSFLNKQYTYFGKVTSGMETIKKINIGDKIESIEIK